MQGIKLKFEGLCYYSLFQLLLHTPLFNRAFKLLALLIIFLSLHFYVFLFSQVTKNLNQIIMNSLYFSKVKYFLFVD